MTTPSSFYPGSAPIGQMFTDVLIAQRSVEKYVVKTYPHFNLYNKIIDALGGQPALSHQGNRLFEMYHKGNTYPAASIARRTVSGAYLILEWDDVNFMSLIPGNAVESVDTDVLGLVVETQPGWAKIGFYYSSVTGTTAFTSSDFPAGSTVSDRGDVSNIQSSGSKQRIVRRPYRNLNIVDLVRVTSELGFDEMNQLTYVTNMNGQPYYAMNQVLEDMEYASMIKYVRTTEGVFKNDPKYPMGGGFKWQISAQGGTMYPLSAAVTESDFKNLITRMILNGGTIGSELLMVAGTSFLSYFQSFMAQYIVTAGDTNTFGGASVKGIDITNYYYMGKHIRIICDPTRDNPNVFKNETSSVLPGTLLSSHSAYVFDTSKVQTESGLEPFIKKYYFGPQGADMWMTPVNGLVTIQNGIASIATNSTLSAKQEIVYNCTTQLTNPAAHAYIYLSI